MLHNAAVADNGKSARLVNENDAGSNPVGGMKTTQKGALGRALAIGKLESLGWSVSTPIKSPA